MKKLLFVFLLVSSASYSDWGDTYYCQMTSLVEIDTDGTLERYKLQKFQFKLDETKKSMVFGIGGYFDGAENQLDLDFAYPQAEMWRATDNFNSLFFDDGKFIYTMTTYDIALTIVADCNKF